MAINPLKILFVASEVEGLVKTGGLADVARALPLYLAQKGHDVRIILPFYKTIKRRDEARLIASRWLPTHPGLPDIGYRIYQMELEGVCVYLIDCPQYFDRPQLYAENKPGLWRQRRALRLLLGSGPACLRAAELRPPR